MIRYTLQILICQDDARSQWPRTSRRYFRSAGADSISGSGFPRPALAPPLMARVFTHFSPRNRLDFEYFTRNSITVKLLPFHIRTLLNSPCKNHIHVFLSLSKVVTICRLTSVRLSMSLEAETPIPSPHEIGFRLRYYFYILQTSC